MNPVIYLVIALTLGTILGFERTLAHKVAGVRTYGLVSMGSCLFVILSQFVGGGLNVSSPGLLYVLQGLIIGIGFIGGGTILHNRQNNHEHTSGLTTAAGLWLNAGIGAAVGYGLLQLAFFATAATLIVFTIFWKIEKKIIKTQIPDGE